MSKLASILRDKDIVFFQADRMSLDPYFMSRFKTLMNVLIHL